MKTHITFLLSVFFVSISLQAQTTTIGNNSSNSADYLGWDNLVLGDLQIRHDNNRNIRLSTNGNLSWGIRSDGKLLGGTTNPANGRLRVFMDDDPTVNYAIYGLGNNNDGGLFVARNGTTNAGCAGEALSTSVTAVANFGVLGGVVCPDPTVPEFGAGVYGRAICAGSSFGGFFDGNVFTAGNNQHLSDASIKTNITPLLDASSIIANLEPRQYEFIPQPADGLILPEGLQYGLMAQDLEAVIPTAVKDVVYSGGLDPGIYENEPLEFKAVKYQLIIPVLIAAFQERQSSLQEANATLTALKSEVHRLENSVAIAQYERIHSE